MRRTLLFVLVLVIVGGSAAGLAWRFNRPVEPVRGLTLYGNVDLRQVELAFNNDQRIADVLVQEGDRVKAGQVLARLDSRRLAAQVAQAEADRAAQAAVVERLRNGSRPQEIAQARANVAASEADAAIARVHVERLESAAVGQAVGPMELQDAKSALDVAVARLESNKQALDLLVAGPRKEDIQQAEAQLRASEAQIAFLQQQMADTELFAPIDATVRSRLMEPGEMASPTKPVFTLAITDPKWVRAYVSEPDLGRVHPGMKAQVTSDSFPGRRFEGWVGFISSVAEFTPKPVQTQELRTKLVYEIRVFVKDATDDLRLGMPATVHLAIDGATEDGTSHDSVSRGTGGASHDSESRGTAQMHDSVSLGTQGRGP